MKTPMQLLYEQLECTVIQQKSMMSIGEYESFKAGMEMAIAIIEQDGHFEKEKEVMSQVYADGGDWDEVPQPRFENYYNAHFKTK